MIDPEIAGHRAIGESRYVGEEEKCTFPVFVVHLVGVREPLDPRHCFR